MAKNSTKLTRIDCLLDSTRRLYNEDAHPVDAEDLAISQTEYDELVSESIAQGAEADGWVRTSHGVSVYAE
jgi:hypothetical protein